MILLCKQSQSCGNTLSWKQKSLEETLWGLDPSPADVYPKFSSMSHRFRMCCPSHPTKYTFISGAIPSKEIFVSACGGIMYILKVAINSNILRHHPADFQYKVFSVCTWDPMNLAWEPCLRGAVEADLNSASANTDRSHYCCLSGWCRIPLRMLWMPLIN